MVKPDQRPEINLLGDSFDVSESLNGANLEINGQTVEITDTQGFTRDENDTPHFRCIFRRKPQELFIAPFLQHGLPLVITIEGGCVLIKGGNIIQADGTLEQVTKPAVLSKKLGLSKRSVYTLEVVSQQPPLIRATLLSK